MSPTRSTLFAGGAAASRPAALAMIGALALAAAPGLARAADPGAVAPFSNLQPSLALTTTIAPNGAFPSSSSGASPPGADGQVTGFVYDFAGGYAPGTTLVANGQTLGLTSNTTLFSVVGATYGGDGRTTFALPNLSGRTAIGAGPGYAIGSSPGTAIVSPDPGQLPAAVGGGGSAFDNLQPSLALTPLISVGGPFPGQGAPPAANMLGQVMYFAGDYVPSGWMAADGQLLPIAGNQALFSVVGTTYGGDGRTTFALPDLTGRTIVGADPTLALGTTYGETATTISPAQLAGAPVNDDQPSLALNYLIAVTGAFPQDGGGQGFDGTGTTLGQVVAFAGGDTPDGYLPADGRLLQISDYVALFNLIGITYGGDGRTTFALPDLDGRTIIGAGDGYGLGDLVGADSVTLDYTPPSQVPPAGGVPEPSAWVLLIAGFGLAGASLRRSRIARLRTVRA